MEPVTLADPEAALGALERSQQAGRRYSLAILDSVTTAPTISVFWRKYTWRPTFR
jgi:hypothetical protein